MKITLENKEEDSAMHPSQSKIIPASEDILCSRKNTDTAGVNRLKTTRSSKNLLIDAISKDVYGLLNPVLCMIKNIQHYMSTVNKKLRIKIKVQHWGMMRQMSFTLTSVNTFSETSQVYYKTFTRPGHIVVL